MNGPDCGFILTFFLVLLPTSGFEWWLTKKNIDDCFGWIWLLADQAITPSQEVPRHQNLTLLRDHQNSACYHHHHLPNHPSASSSARISTISATVGATDTVSITGWRFYTALCDVQSFPCTELWNSITYSKNRVDYAQARHYQGYKTFTKFVIHLTKHFKAHPHMILQQRLLCEKLCYIIQPAGRYSPPVIEQDFASLCIWIY